MTRPIPTYVTTTTDFYHSLGAAVPNGINSLLFPVYLDLAYDSWVTIGLEGTPNAGIGEANVSTVQSASNPWTTNFDPGGGLAGDNIAIDDLIGGAWYALNGDANGIAGTDLKVLGQFTTTGDFSMANSTPKCSSTATDRMKFRDLWCAASDVLPGVNGCTDATACNYDVRHSWTDGSCEYPRSLVLDCDCAGNCVNDADGDEICDENETIGCTTPPPATTTRTRPTTTARVSS